MIHTAALSTQFAARIEMPQLLRVEAYKECLRHQQETAQGRKQKFDAFLNRTHLADRMLRLLETRPQLDQHFWKKHSLLLQMDKCIEANDADGVRDAVRRWPTQADHPDIEKCLVDLVNEPTFESLDALQGVVRQQAVKRYVCEPDPMSDWADGLSSEELPSLMDLRADHFVAHNLYEKAIGAIEVAHAGKHEMTRLLKAIV